MCIVYIAVKWKLFVYILEKRQLLGHIFEMRFMRVFRESYAHCDMRADDEWHWKNRMSTTWQRRMKYQLQSFNSRVYFITLIFRATFHCLRFAPSDDRRQPAGRSIVMQRPNKGQAFLIYVHTIEK